MKIKIIILGSLFFGWNMTACNDIRFGDDFLGTVPENSGATTDSMFHSKVNADKVLTQAYKFLPYGLPVKPTLNTSNNIAYDKLGMNILEALSDLYYSTRDNQMDGPANLYYRGTLSSNLSSNNQGHESYRFGNELDYSAIRYAWIYIENADKIPDITEEEKRRRVAEAKMIIAISYAEMLRYVGGVPIIDHAIEPDENMKFPRATFSETVDYIIKLIDDAKNDLYWKQNETEDGRMTKAGALGLKLRVLLFAASPTFNSNLLWHPLANEYTCYTNEDHSRWRRALEAGQEFMRELNKNGEYQLIQPEEATHSARRIAFQKAYYDRGGTEILISTRRGFDVNIMEDFFSQRNYSGPTLNYVDMFPWENGEDFPANFNWENPEKEPFYNNGVPTRDPRLYETVTLPGSLCYDGTYAPIYTNNQFFRIGGTGFIMKKFILEQKSERNGRPIQWPYLRLAEVFLSYAEIINECNEGPTAEAYQLVNKIRNRVGLKSLPEELSKEEFREAVLKERALELGFEEVRWFDLVRWNRVEDFTKDLYGLESTALDNPQKPTRFAYKKYKMQNRFWKNNWDTKWYLAPIPFEEINKEYGMTQNPGW